jgi:Icc-related predicted phosphoesterase
MIKRFNEYTNESVRDKMTPISDKNLEKNFKKIFREIEGMDILDKLETLNNKNVLRYLSDEQRRRLVLEVLESKKNEEFMVTGQNDEFYVFENRNGNGMFIFNRNNFKIYHVGLYALREVIGALNYLL